METPAPSVLAATAAAAASGKHLSAGGSGVSGSSGLSGGGGSSASFEKALLSPEAMDSLLLAIDAELKLFEGMRRCMQARAKCDREYAASLTSVAELAQRLNPAASGATDAAAAPDAFSPMFVTWSKVTEETHTLARHVRRKAESVHGAVAKLEQLIDDHSAARRQFADEKAQAERELGKVQQVAVRLHSDYRKAVDRVMAKRSECQELQAKGKTLKIEEANRRYLLACEGVHNAHNKYLLSVREAKLFYDGVYKRTLPKWLSSLQAHMESSVAQCKQVLQEYAKATDLSTNDCLAVFKNVAVMIDGVAPPIEYANMVERLRKPAEIPTIDFDETVLQGYEGSLVPKELSVNTATTEVLSRSRFDYEDRLSEANAAHDRLSSELQAINEAPAKSHISKQMELESLLRRVDEQRQLSERLQNMMEYVKERLRVSPSNGSGGGSSGSGNDGEAPTSYPPLPEAMALTNGDGFASVSAAAHPVIADASRSAGGRVRAQASFSSESAQQNSGGDDSGIDTGGSSTTSGGGNTGSGSRPASVAPGTAQGTGVGNSRRTGVDTVTNMFSKLARAFKSGSQSEDYSAGASATQSGSSVPDASGGRSGSSTTGVTSSHSNPTITKKGSSNTLMMKSGSSKEMAASGSDAGRALHLNIGKKSTGGEVSPAKADAVSPTEPEYMQGRALQPAEVADARRNLEDLDWFHGLLPREEIVRLLREDGDFLLRESKKRDTQEILFVLSVMWQGHKHFIIQATEGGWKLEGLPLPTIRELIMQKVTSGSVVTVRSQAVLKRPIAREPWQLNNDEVVMGSKIGSGNFGDVFKGIYKGGTVAIKTCKEELSDEQKKKFIAEGKILRQYDHPNIVQFIGIAAQKNPVLIVMEFVTGGALLSWLRNHQAEPHRTLLSMCIDAALGMEYLATKNVIHRDLAARNCLVAVGNVVKISDFGMSREESEYIMSTSQMRQIPIKWTAPEALNYGRYTLLSDVWSYGILMWEVFSYGKNPYPSMRNQEARERVDQGYRMSAPDGCPPAVHDLMQRCWQAEPDKRPPFTQIIKDLRLVLPTV